MELEDRKQLKNIILRKKMFKKPKELSLLTWAAKEQIRFLNSEYPEEWPVDRLVESFPVSRESVIAILKSSYIPRNDAEVIRHDQKVQKHWQTLKKIGKHNSKEDGGPMDPTLNYLLESKKMNLLLHAGGHKSLPMPSQLRTQVRLAGLENKTVKPGPFSKIVLSYEQKVAKKSEKSETKNDEETNKKDHMAELSNVKDNMKLLESVIETFIPIKKMDNLPVPETVSKSTNKEISESLGSQNKEERTKTVLSRREKRLLKEKDTGLNVNITNIPVEKLQMLDTRKVVHAKIPSEDDNHEEIQQKQKENSEILDELPESEIGNHRELHTLPLRYEETDSGKGEKVHQAYLYDEKHGYQYPLGIVDESLRSIKVPKGKKQKFYRKGDIVYDENGDFLYRIP